MTEHNEEIEKLFIKSNINCSNVHEFFQKELLKLIVPDQYYGLDLLNSRSVARSKVNESIDVLKEKYKDQSGTIFTLSSDRRDNKKYVYYTFLTADLIIKFFDLKAFW